MGHIWCGMAVDPNISINTSSLRMLGSAYGFSWFGLSSFTLSRFNSIFLLVWQNAYLTSAFVCCASHLQSCFVLFSVLRLKPRVWQVLKHQAKPSPGGFKMRCPACFLFIRRHGNPALRCLPRGLAAKVASSSASVDRL